MGRTKQNPTCMSSIQVVSRILYLVSVTSLEQFHRYRQTICIKGLAIRATPVIPDMRVAFFWSLTSSHTVQVEIDRDKIEEPGRCPRCVCASVELEVRLTYLSRRHDLYDPGTSKSQTLQVKLHPMLFIQETYVFF